MSAPGAEPYTFGVGHNGCDYGTYAHSLYLPGLEAGLSIIINRDATLVFVSAPALLVLDNMSCVRTRVRTRVHTRVCTRGWVGRWAGAGAGAGAEGMQFDCNGMETARL